MDTTGIDARNVFVVHGRNNNLRQAMFAFLRAINLNPIEWSEAVSQTGAGAPYIGEILNVAFSQAKAIVVLFTPDEIAYLQPVYGSGQDDPDTHPAPQARPNVLFEAGMAFGRNPKHTILVEVGDMRPFSDVTGRHVIRMTNEIAKRQELATRLTTAGCHVNTTGIDWHTAGDFTAPPPPGQNLPVGRRVPSTQATRPLIFDATYHDSDTSKRAGRLLIINRGNETAYDVTIKIPEDASLSFNNAGHEPIPKLPGHGKSVSLTVWNHNRMFGGEQHQTSFDLLISARTESGTEFSEEVFLDTN